MYPGVCAFTPPPTPHPTPPTPHHTPPIHPTTTPAPQEQVKLSVQLAKPLSQLQEAAKHIAEVSCECNLEVDTGVWASG